MRQSHRITLSTDIGIDADTINARRPRIVPCLPRGGEIRQIDDVHAAGGRVTVEIGSRAIISAAYRSMQGQ